MADDGASPEEQLLFACRSDNLDLFTTLTSTSDTQLNVNTTDSIGRTPLHLAVMYQSTDVLPQLLEEEVDVDLQESKEGDTPLHSACRLGEEEDEERRNWIVDQLLSSGADPRVRNHSNQKPVDVLVGAAKERPLGQELYRMLREAEAQAGFSQKGDIVDEDDDESDGGTPSDDD
ncbi:ankyrin [Jaminaea rosea]|uniref:Ankyrin n=1 Tax=Jaminaea rosea TaxID=1569628 RepID=A0A316V1J0_9BASI|nr:ankyrin [Jaminaea rosea]PWN30043.1 ankyrin [Jaminaea rosea]